MSARYLQLAADKPVRMLRLIILALLLKQESAPSHDRATGEDDAHSRFWSLARRGARPRAYVDTAAGELDVYSLQLTAMPCLLCMQTATSSQTVQDSHMGKDHRTFGANVQDTDQLLYSCFTAACSNSGQGSNGNFQLKA